MPGSVRNDPAREQTQLGSRNRAGREHTPSIQRQGRLPEFVPFLAFLLVLTERKR